MRSDELVRVFIIPNGRERKESTFLEFKLSLVLSLRSEMFLRVFIISREESAREIHSRALCGDVRHPSTQGSLFILMLKNSRFLHSEFRLRSFYHSVESLHVLRCNVYKIRKSVGLVFIVTIIDHVLDILFVVRRRSVTVYLVSNVDQ